MSERSSTSSAKFVPVRFLAPKVDVDRRNDGSLILRSPEPLASYPRCLGEHLERWAHEKPNDAFLAERDVDGWRTLTWVEAIARVRALGAALLKRELSPAHPVAILSGNSINHALVALAAMHVGVPVAPISPAYSLMSQDFVKLRSAFSLLEPEVVFAENAKQFAPAIDALCDYHFELVVAAGGEHLSKAALTLAELSEKENPEAVDLAFRKVGPDTIAKFLLTSGSTGEPKAVVNTQRMLCSNQQSLTQAWPFLDEEPPVLVDWLPWNHTFGGNNNLGMVLTHGGTLYIDEGKPAPGLIETTVRNLREISPTVYYNAPRGYDALAPYLETDPVLRRSFFARLKVMCYSGAGMPANLWERLERISVSELGKRVRMST
ncbi:MAG: AMP-binding protein, partial [Blastocatellia bacterium]